MWDAVLMKLVVKMLHELFRRVDCPSTRVCMLLPLCLPGKKVSLTLEMV